MKPSNREIEKAQSFYPYWMAVAVALLLLPAVGCHKGPQELQPTTQKEGTPAAPATEQQESAKERPAQAPPAKSQEDMEKTRKQLEQQGTQYTEAAFLRASRMGTPNWLRNS